MKILMIGAHGTIGKRVQEALSGRHEIITAGRNSGDIQVDITSTESIENLFRRVETLDACVITASGGSMSLLQDLTEEKIQPAIDGKLMGQVNVVLIGQHYLNDGGSFTLTSGILSEDPVRGAAAYAIVNGGVNSFVLAASRELTRDIRINVVSPGVVEDSYEKFRPYFPGYNPVPMSRIVNAYLKSVEGVINGQILKVYE
jgi:NAD(P)-dependent dehydrogenase (short-subunit alcohol dehydrogenase family)